MQEMHRIFDRSTMGHDAGWEILRLRQGNNSVSDYLIEFQTLATDSGWEGRALVDSFLHGLSEPDKDELLTRELPEDLDQIIALAIWIDSRLEDRRCYSKQHSPPRYFSNRRRPSPTPSSRPPPTPSPIKNEPGTKTEVMMVDHSKLMKEERGRRFRNRACLYCGRGWVLRLKLPGKRVMPTSGPKPDLPASQPELDWGHEEDVSTTQLRCWGEFLGRWNCCPLGNSPDGGFTPTSGQLPQWPANWVYHQGYRPSPSSHLW